ncbi:MAG: 23S rRNA (adenine(1618)-N(6))-methyltransferase RlmF [Oceanihabitans sp.]
MNKESKLHPKNIHRHGYNLEALVAVLPGLKLFLITNKYGNTTIDFANPKAVKALNIALLYSHYNISSWSFPDSNLCPPIPSRADYIHYLNDILEAFNLQKEVTVLDIGTGATCIYPLLGKAIYNWNFIATDIDKNSLNNAQKIIDANSMQKAIKLRFQKQNKNILKEILLKEEKITATICNPPFYKNEIEAQQATDRKLLGLNIKTPNSIRNFSGSANELWYPGGEKAFLHNYIYESSLFKNNCFWFTSLVSKKELLRGLKVSLKKLGATDVKVIAMEQGNKKMRIIAWTFLTIEEQKKWNTF